MGGHNKHTPLPHQLSTSPSTSFSTSPATHAATSTSGPTNPPPHLPPPTQIPPPNDTQNFPPLATSTPTAPPPSWASLLKINRKIGNGWDLREINVDQNPGPQSIMYEFKEEQVLTLENSWGICLIGYILGRFPGLNAFNEVRKSWGVPTKYQFHDSEWMIFKFENEEDREKVLTNGPYSSFGIPWMLKKMPQFFRFQEESFTLIPTWIKFPRLPLQLFGDEALSVLASFVGKPIQTDYFTKAMNKPAYARVLVEVDATKPLMREITFKVPNGEVIHQEVEYEYEPQVCTKCHTLGHDQEKCKGPKKFQSRGRSKSRSRGGMANIAETETLPSKTAAIQQLPQENGINTTRVAKDQMTIPPAETAAILPKTAVNPPKTAAEVISNIRDISLAKNDNQTGPSSYPWEEIGWENYQKGYTEGDESIPTDSDEGDIPLRTFYEELKEEAKKRQPQREESKKQRECAKQKKKAKKQKGKAHVEEDLERASFYDDMASENEKCGKGKKKGKKNKT